MICQTLIVKWQPYKYFSKFSWKSGFFCLVFVNLRNVVQLIFLISLICAIEAWTFFKLRVHKTATLHKTYSFPLMISPVITALLSSVHIMYIYKKISHFSEVGKYFPNKKFSQIILKRIITEAVVPRCSVKKMFLEISQKKIQKKRLWYRCFLVNFVKFLRTPFYIEHLWWLLL